MGNYIRPLSDVVFSIASDNLWIEDSAIQQLYTTAKLTGMKRVIGMPDLHPGAATLLAQPFLAWTLLSGAGRQRYRLRHGVMANGYFRA